MELIYQEEKEVKPVYDMYQKIFEDPEEFAKYYFEEVYASNEVILAVAGDASAAKTAVLNARQIGLELLIAMGSYPETPGVPYL